MGMELETELCWAVPEKWNVSRVTFQEFNIWCKILQDKITSHGSVALLFLSQQGFIAEVSSFSSFHRFPVGYGVCQLLVKNHIDGSDRRPNFVLFVVCSGLIVGGWVVLGWSRKSHLGSAEIMYMCDAPIDIVECIWVNLWCMVDWIWSQNSKNSYFLHTAGQLVRRTNNGMLFIYKNRNQA